MLITPSFGTPDICDTFPGLATSCSTQFHQYGGRKIFEGRISTVRCFQDNGLLRPILSQPGEGRVLVIDGGGSLDRALVGDVTVGMAADNGWAGLVINGAVRDVRVLAGLATGVKALGVNAQRAGNAGVGERDVPVTFGTLTFVPGAWIFSDDDGLTCLDELPEGTA
jgi:regulator of ribonuclease activity A